MPRLPRYDRPGGLYHAMNRAMARRPGFERRDDMRYFLSRIAYAVRRGDLLVYAYCIMTTHYHLLVGSPAGRLSEAMRRIQNEYVRYFNRRRRRDGPLFRGRFHSKPVTSVTHRDILLRYIDNNPVKARLSDTPWDYPYGSARHYVHGTVPPWLCGDWILAAIPDVAGADYTTTWGRRPTDAEHDFVKQRILTPGLPDDPLDDLVRAAPSRVRAWMERKALLADGTRPGLPLVPAATVRDVAAGLEQRGFTWRYRTPSGQRRDAWRIATTALLHHLAGQSLKAVAALEDITQSAVVRRLAIHAQLCGDEAYGTRLGRVAALCFRTAFDGRGGEGRRRQAKRCRTR